MSTYHITGQIPLKGNVVIAGRKNAALKLIAATILTDQPVTLTRLPDIGDVTTMLQILEAMGATINRTNNQAVIDTSTIRTPEIPSDLARKLRASIVLVGPLLARFKQVTFPHPGGCVIGKRSIMPHLEAFKDLGATIDFDGTTYHLSAPELTGTDIYLREQSVTATENMIMAAVRAKGHSAIYNAAQERHIINLCDLLRALGYEISGDGTSTLEIEGSESLASQAAEIAILPDELEVGTFAVAAAITQGDVTLEQVGSYLELFPILHKLEDFGVNYTYNAEMQTLRIQPSSRLVAADIQTRPWPGFPTDLQSPFTVLATQAQGTSLIHDWMYEGRLYFVDLLQRMGANVVTCDPHRALVSGPTPLMHSSLISPDIRAGAALVLAALAAEGTSIIEHAELIERGYAQLPERLQKLGADITREED